MHLRHSDPSAGYKYNFGVHVDLSGDITIHMVPTLLLGISVLNGQLIEANAYVKAGKCSKNHFSLYVKA